MTAVKEGDRVVVAIDRMAQRYAVRPMTGRKGRVLTTAKGRMLDRAKVELDDGAVSWFHFDELEVTADAVKPEDADLIRRRALYEAELMLGTHVFDLPKLIRILKGKS